VYNVLSYIVRCRQLSRECLYRFSKVIWHLDEKLFLVLYFDSVPPTCGKSTKALHIYLNIVYTYRSHPLRYTRAETLKRGEKKPISNFLCSRATQTEEKPEKTSLGLSSWGSREQRASEPSSENRSFSVRLHQWFSTFLKLPSLWEAKCFSTPPSLKIKIVYLKSV